MYAAARHNLSALGPARRDERRAKAQGDHQLITREDGQQQWTYKGKPLYKWYADKKPGDKGGDGLRQVWHVAVP